MATLAALLKLNGPPEPRPPEADEHRRARHLETMREVAELGMALARRATVQALEPKPEPEAAEPDAPRPPDPTLAFARATRAVCHATLLEARLAAGLIAPRARLRPQFARQAHPLAGQIRNTLYKLAATAEPDRALRAELRRYIDERVDEQFSQPTPPRIPATVMQDICADLGFPYDVSKVSDELLGMPPPNYQRPPDGASRYPPYPSPSD